MPAVEASFGGEVDPNAIVAAGGALLEHFKVGPDPYSTPRHFLEAIAQLDPNFQGQRDMVHYRLETDQTEWAPSVQKMITNTAASIGLLQTETPLIGLFGSVVVPGRPRESSLDSARYAAAALASNQATTSELIVAGSSRKLLPAEKENAQNYAPDAVTEFDLCAAAAKTVAQENPGLTTSQMLIDKEKADTSAVIEAAAFDAFMRGLLLKRGRLGVVTDQFHQPSTALDLALILRRVGGVQGVVAGNSSNPEIVAKRTPATYLTAITRTLRAATLLISARQR